METKELLLRELGFVKKEHLAAAIVNDPDTFYHMDQSNKALYKKRVRSVGSSLSQYLFTSRKIPDNLFQALVIVFSKTPALGNFTEKEAKAIEFIKKIKELNENLKAPSTNKLNYSELIEAMEKATNIVVMSPNPPELIFESYSKSFNQVKSYLDLLARKILQIGCALHEKGNSELQIQYYVPNESDGNQIWESLKKHVIRFIYENKDNPSTNHLIASYLKNKTNIETCVGQEIIHANNSGNIVIHHNSIGISSFSLILFDYEYGYTCHRFKEDHLRLNKLAAEDITNLKKFELYRMKSYGTVVHAKKAFMAEFLFFQN